MRSLKSAFRKETFLTKAIFLTGIVLATTPLLAQDKAISSEKVSPAATTDQITAGVRAGVVSVSSIDSSLGSYGVFGDYTVDQRVSLGGTLDYWTLSTGTLSDSPVSVNDVSLGVNGKFIFTDIASAFKPFATAGVSLHRISISEYGESDGSNSITRYAEKNNNAAAEFGIDYGAGAVYTIQRQVDVNGQVLMRRLTSTGTTFNQVGLTAGVGYRM